MRRLPLLAVLALPVIVIAAISAGSGQVVEVSNFDATTGFSYINRAHCDEVDQLDLEWNVPSFSTGGSYRIIASNKAPASSGDGAGFCPADDPNASPPVSSNQVEAPDADSAVQQEAVSGAAVATAAGFECDSPDEAEVVHVCVHWVDSTDVRRAAAIGKFKIQVEAPAPPVITGVGSGSGRLDVSWDPGVNGTVEADHYVAFATTVVGGPVVASATTDAESVTLRGLVNFTTYLVFVQAFSIGGNPSGLSDPAEGTPTPSAGFWDICRERGCLEEGGCATGAAGPLGLLATALLLARRRRKP